MFFSFVCVGGRCAKENLVYCYSRNIQLLGLILFWNIPNLLDWQAREPRYSVVSESSYFAFLTWVLGMELSSFASIVDDLLTDLSPAQSYFFFSLLFSVLCLFFPLSIHRNCFLFFPLSLYSRALLWHSLLVSLAVLLFSRTKNLQTLHKIFPILKYNMPFYR